MRALNNERIRSVRHWTDTLFSFTTTRDPGFRFQNGQFTMLGLEVEGRPVESAGAFRVKLPLTARTFPIQKASGMALTDIKPAASHGLFRHLRTRTKAWLTSEHSLTQRIASTAFAIRVASAAIVFGSQILLARWMGGNEFGTYVYAWTWLLVVGDLVHLGVPLTAQRFVPEYRQAGALDLLRGFLVGSRWVTLGVGAAVGAVGVVAVYALAPWLDPNVVVPLYFVCLALPFSGFTFLLDAQARSYDWINLALLPAYVVRPLLIITVVATLHFSGFTIDAATVTGVLAGAFWLSALIQLFQLRRRLSAAVPAGPRRYDLRKWLHTSLPILLVWGMYTLLTSTDVLVLKQFRPAQEVAHYYAAAKTLTLVSIIQFAVAAAAGHRFTAHHVSGDHAALAAFAADTVKWVFWPSLAATLLMLLLGKFVLMLFGADFVSGYPIMAILAAGLMARASVGPAERLLNMLGQQRICALAYATAFTVNLIGCLALAPAYGAIGVACATAAAFIVESSLLFAIARRRLGIIMFVWRPPAA